MPQEVLFMPTKVSFIPNYDVYAKQHFHMANHSKKAKYQEFSVKILA